MSEAQELPANTSTFIISRSLRGKPLPQCLLQIVIRAVSLLSNIALSIKKKKHSTIIFFPVIVIRNTRQLSFYIDISKSLDRLSYHTVRRDGNIKMAYHKLSLILLETLFVLKAY